MKKHEHESHNGALGWGHHAVCDSNTRLYEENRENNHGRDRFDRDCRVGHFDLSFQSPSRSSRLAAVTIGPIGPTCSLNLDFVSLLMNG